MVVVIEVVSSALTGAEVDVGVVVAGSAERSVAPVVVVVVVEKVAAVVVMV